MRETSWDTPVPRERFRRAALALALASSLALGALLAGGPPAAEAKVPKSSVKKLRKAKCPPRYQVRVARGASVEEIQQAKRGIFRIAGRDVEITRKLDWSFDPVGSAAFRARLHDLRWLDTLLYAYRTNGDRQALRKAKRIVVHWVKSNPRSDPSTDRTWFDKVAGDRIAYIAYVTRAARCERMLRNKRLARKLLGSIDEHADFLAPSKDYPANNRGLFVDMGLILAGKQTRFLPSANKRRKRAQRRFLRTVDEFTDFREAFWLEHSTTYQFLTINVISRFLEVTRRERPALERLVENMRQTAGWLVEPDKRWWQAGNSYQNPAKGWVKKIAKKQRGMRVLEESGLAFVRKRKRYLALLSTFHGPTHKHSDELSFDLFEQGRRLVSDTGLPTKDLGPANSFAVSAPAHSVLTVDGVDFPRDAASAYGSGIRASGGGDGWFAIEAANPLVASQGVEHVRTLLYRPGFALIVADRVRSTALHSYRRYLHFGPHWRLEYLPDKLRLHKRGQEFTVATYSTAPEERRTVRARKNPFQGFVWTDFGERDPRWSAWFATEAASQDTAITISTNPKREARATLADRLGDGSDLIEITENGELTRRLRLTRSGNQLTVSQQKLENPEPAPEPADPGPYLP